MKRIGKWLALIGFGIPLVIFLWGQIRVYNYALANGADSQRSAIESMVSRDLKITMVGLPVGVVGIICWAAGSMRRHHP
jgi:cell division protein FtsX